MSQKIDKYELMKYLNALYGVNSLSQAGKAIDHILEEMESGRFDAQIDYQQRYEALVQAVYDFNTGPNSTAEELIAWMESVCPHFDDAHEAYKKRMLEDDSND